MLPMMETRAAAEMIRPKDVFSSVTAEQKQTLVSLAPPEKDHIQSASAMVDRVDRPPQPVAPMAAVSAIGLGFREVDEDEGIGKQTAAFNATPANEKTARTAINADDKQSDPDTATGAASERSRAGASFSVSAQEKRPDRQSDAVPDVKSAAAANPLPIEPLPTPAQQIISGLTQQYARLEPVQVSGRQITEAEPDPMARGGIKILRIRLQPETLGEVEVTLRRAGSEVKVGLLVGSEATAATLRQDLGTLQDRLISSLLGDTTPVIEITVRDQALQSQGQYPPGAGPGSGYNLTGGNDTGSNRRPSSDRDANSFSSGRGEDDEQMDSDRRSYSGLVV
jgi:flagellar hook-length control protein FliK